MIKSYIQDKRILVDSAEPTLMLQLDENGEEIVSPPDNVVLISGAILRDKNTCRTKKNLTNKQDKQNEWNNQTNKTNVTN